MPPALFQREHLHMALSDTHMVVVPSHGVLHNLAVHAGIVAELVVLCPLFEIEETAEKLEGFGFVDQTQSQGAAEVGLKDGRAVVHLQRKVECPA
jgi:hypothetical protein